MLWCFVVIDLMPEKRTSVPNLRSPLRSLPAAPDGVIHRPRRGGARRWRGVAIAAALSCALAGNAWALALGRLSVQSLLGEPLRAEIDVPALTDAEAASLQIGLAPPERFRAANLDFNPLLQEVALTLERRPDGRAVIVLRSNRPVGEPFLDVVVQARWAGGELLRGYTLLFDPPNLRPVAPVAPAVNGPTAVPAVPATPPAPPSPVVTDVRPAQPVPAPAPAPRASAASAPAQRPQRIAVRPGDTAGRIAAAHKPADVTLEQMLVALLRANPNAFIRGNVHLLRAGAVIDLPDGASAAPVDAQEARRILAAQTRDFNEYRRRLAQAAPRQEAPAATRAATGGVQAAVAEDKPQASAQDRLTLSKPGAAPAEARIAQERQRNESEQRVAELNRNLQELEQLRQAATAPTPAPDTAPAAPSPTAPTPAAAGLEVAATPPVAAAPSTPSAEPPAAPAPEPASEPTAAAPAAPPAPPPASAPAPAPSPEPSALAALLGHPLVIPAAGGVAVLLAVLAWWRLRQRRHQAPPSPPQESDIDTVGQAAGTGEPVPASPVMPSPDEIEASSPLDAGADVDPVAEADVYLAYGRDQQAEEILLEALRLTPDRLPVRLKLLEIYAQRPDATRFEAAARELYALTEGQGPEWERACELGQTLDPDNPLYRPATGQAGGVAGATASAMTAGTVAGASDLPELDLPAAPSGAPTPADEGLDFDLDLPPTEGAARTDDPAAAMAETPSLPPELAELSLDLPGDDALAGLDGADTAREPIGANTPNDDLSSQEVAEGLTEADPLETKLSLAREFEAIGDIDGARTLAEEVVAEATGELQERARAFLAQLA